MEEETKIAELLNEIKPVADDEHCEDLLGTKTLDSLSLTMLIAKLDQAFDVEITPEDLEPENFKTVHAIAELIRKLED